MAATPFSPFVGRRIQKAPAIKRRQSELPSDLIDWDAPEIPELDKQRIIYEDYIKELTEDHEIETVLNEQIFKIAHDTIVEEYKLKVKRFEDDASKERAKVNLMLGQIKMFEQNVNESNERVDELEKQIKESNDCVEELKKQVNEQQDAIKNLEQEKAKVIEERDNLNIEIEELNFRNNETIVEANHNLELFEQMKNEADEYKKTLEAIRDRSNYYKKLVNPEMCEE